MKHLIICNLCVAFLIIAVIWSTEVNLLLTTTPESRWLSTSSKFTLFNGYLNLILSLNFNTTHFSSLNFKCHLFDQGASLLRSCCNSSHCCLVLTDLYSFLSSANIFSVDFISSGRSFIYSKSSSGPKIGPCGTPLDTGSQLEIPFRRTTCCLLPTTDLPGCCVCAAVIMLMDVKSSSQSIYHVNAHHIFDWNVNSFLRVTHWSLHVSHCLSHSKIFRVRSGDQGIARRVAHGS